MEEAQTSAPAESAPAVTPTPPETQAPPPAEAAASSPPAGDDVELTPVKTSEVSEEHKKEETADLFGDESPEWIKALDQKPAFKVDKESIDGLPIEAKQLVHNMRNKMLQTTQQNADLRKELQGELEKVKALQQAAKIEQNGVYDLFKHPELQKMMTPPDGRQPDPYTKEGQEWIAKKNFAGLFKQFTDKVTAIAEERNQAVIAEQQETAKQARVQQIKAFAEKHEDFAEHYEDIKKMVDTYGLPAEKAYEYVRLDKGLHQRDEVADARAQSRSYMAQGGNRNRPLVRQRPEGDSRDLMDFYKQNPDVMKADLDKYRRMGVGYK